MILAHMTLWVVELKRFWIFEILNHYVLFAATTKFVGWSSIIAIPTPPGKTVHSNSQE